MIAKCGTYYMISRSLGPEFGAAVGIVFSLANAVAVALHTVGFCESLNDLLKSLGVRIIDNAENDIRIVGGLTLVLLGGIVCIGMEWEAKAQLVLMVILTLSLVNFVVGAIMGPSTELERSRGYTGMSWNLFMTNMKPEYRNWQGQEQNFVTLFAIFFPAATGILAGANISGDLKDPSTAIPKGTILAIITTSVSYILFGAIAGACVKRDASGESHSSLPPWMSFSQNGDCQNGNCKWGLQNSFQVMELISAYGPLNYAGCFAATLSSALACFVSAPKVFQALCKDNLFPKLDMFAKGYGRNNEPLNGYILTFFIALAFIAIANLNTIAPLISNFFLASYALVNFSTFHIDLVKPVGWRPSFKYYNKWLSLLGAILSVISMFLCSWYTALVTFAVVTGLYFFVRRRKVDINWGSSPAAQNTKLALQSLSKMADGDDHIKTYSPHMLVLSGDPYCRPALVDFANMLCKRRSLLICADISENHLTDHERKDRQRSSSDFLKLHKIQGYYVLYDGDCFEESVRRILLTAGVGKLRPNVVLLGYKDNWNCSRASALTSYYNTVQYLLDSEYGVAILRVSEGLDLSATLGVFNPSRNISPYAYASVGVEESNSSGICGRSQKIGDGKDGKQSEVPFMNKEGEPASPMLIQAIYRFRKPKHSGHIDVWWLYDDGGLTVLLPHILTLRSAWSSCKLRIFCYSRSQEGLSEERLNLAGLLNKFRIPVKDVILVLDVQREPLKPTTTAWYNSFLAETASKGLGIPVEEIESSRDLTEEHLKVRENLLIHSRNAHLVVITMPVPHKSTTPAIFMSWLDVLSRDLPPVLFVRGNQQSVLTVYS